MVLPLFALGLSVLVWNLMLWLGIIAEIWHIKKLLKSGWASFRILAEPVQLLVL